MTLPLIVNDAITLPPNELVWSAARASGPGGQNVNKVASKVELRFNLPNTTALPDDVRERLRTQAAGRLDADGWVMVVSQKTRDQPKNLEDAREKLKAMILKALVVPTPRKPTKVPKGVVRRRLENKAHTAVRKEGRKPVRGDE